MNKNKLYSVLKKASDGINNPNDKVQFYHYDSLNPQFKFDNLKLKLVKDDTVIQLPLQDSNIIDLIEKYGKPQQVEQPSNIINPNKVTIINKESVLIESMGNGMEKYIINRIESGLDIPYNINLEFNGIEIQQSSTPTLTSTPTIIENTTNETTKQEVEKKEGEDGEDNNKKRKSNNDGEGDEEVSNKKLKQNNEQTTVTTPTTSTNELIFGKLQIILPSKFQGGEIKISYNNEKEESISIKSKAKPSSSSTTELSSTESLLPFEILSYFNDCNLNISPITNGYRVLLNFNLICNENDGKKLMPTSKSIINYPAIFRHLVQEFKNQKVYSPLVYISNESTNQNELTKKDTNIKNVLIEISKNSNPNLIVLSADFKMTQEYCSSKRNGQYTRVTNQDNNITELSNLQDCSNTFIDDFKTLYNQKLNVEESLLFQPLIFDKCKVPKNEMVEHMENENYFKKTKIFNQVAFIIFIKPLFGKSFENWVTIDHDNTGYKTSQFLMEFELQSSGNDTVDTIENANLFLENCIKINHKLNDYQYLQLLQQQRSAQHRIQYGIYSERGNQPKSFIPIKDIEILSIDPIDLSLISKYLPNQLDYIKACHYNLLLADPVQIFKQLPTIHGYFTTEQLELSILSFKSTMVSEYLYAFNTHLYPFHQQNSKKLPLESIVKFIQLFESELITVSTLNNPRPVNYKTANKQSPQDLQDEINFKNEWLLLNKLSPTFADSIATQLSRETKFLLDNNKLDKNSFGEMIKLLSIIPKKFKQEIIDLKSKYATIKAETKSKKENDKIEKQKLKDSKKSKNKKKK